MSVGSNAESPSREKCNSSLVILEARTILRSIALSFLFTFSSLSTKSLSISTLSETLVRGVLISWAMPAARIPMDVSFSDWEKRSN